MKPHDLATLAVHAGEAPDPATGALDPPVVLSSAFAFPSAEDAAARFAGRAEGYIYSRWKNPTVQVFEAKVAALEGAEAAVATASGMAAVHGAVSSLLASGDHVVAPRSLYAETARMLRARLGRFDVDTTFVDFADLEAVRAAVRPRTRVIFAENPANPTLAITDLEAVAKIAHDAGAWCLVDNTFATPYHQQPLALGADLVIHAATKALCGHGDAVGGVACGEAGLVDRVRDETVRQMGAAMSPTTAWILTRGIRTLALRATWSARSALALAERLEGDGRIAHVWYPGLPGHPGHAVARKQMHRGYGSVLAFEVKGGLEAGRRLHDQVEVITRAVSLGDTRSLLTHPATTTHASMSEAARAEAGIPEGLVRLAVGIEDLSDLWDDLDQALR